ncbi:Protoporphyrinogen IX oxidase, novel form, HemJ [uncultured Candidatus Thioglobus sp.]|nr:Protoporphyrinogen IX oxidase, novel form, HemJ [uncultured Candidatus Thioglobus sp.]
MLWVKAFHIISIITWFAALFYLPRLFVYHTMSDDEKSIKRFKVMERKLYRGIMMPSFIIATVLGLWMLQDYAWQAYSGQYWLHTKLALVVLLIGYHFYCGHLVTVFKQDKNTHSHIFYRWFNEFPVLLLVAIIILVVVKPY